MRILVTGGAGFIASHVVDAYVADGHEVAVVDDLSTGNRAHVSPHALFYEVDIRDEALMRRVFEEFRPQVVNHHAAQVDVRRSVADPIGDAQINILGSLSLLQACIAVGVEQVVFASTGGAMYGEPRRLPADERQPAHPLSGYGVGKRTVELYLQAYARNYGLRYAMLRYGNVYGPRQNADGEAGVIAVFIGRMLAGEQPAIFGDGRATRDYVYVGDVVRANLLATGLRECMLVNIGTGIGTSVTDLYRLIAAETGVTEPPCYVEKRVGEVEAIYLDASLAREMLGWEPQISLQDGIRRTVAYQREQG